MIGDVRVAARPATPRLLRFGLRVVRSDPSAVVAGSLLIALFVLATVGAPLAEFLTGHGPEQPLSGGLSPAGIPLSPLYRARSWRTAHPILPARSSCWARIGLAVDAVVRLLYGARVTLVVGLGGDFDRPADRRAPRSGRWLFPRPDGCHRVAWDGSGYGVPIVVLRDGLAAVLGPGLLDVVVVIALFSWYYPARWSARPS